MTVCVTGMLLSFEKELTPLLWPKEQRVFVLENRLPIDAIVSKAKIFFRIKGFFVWKSSLIPQGVIGFNMVQKKKYWYAYINPYTGEVLSKGAQAERFFKKYWTSIGFF
ncbi:PepSY domain-containing protein [Sphingobacterium sp. E70]|nr:PepSY domain-containing protein [Sphingobacterium sp. E70]